MSNIRMEFFVTITEDGLYHVQNIVFPHAMKGQHHVHTKEGFEKWKENIKEDFIHIEEKLNSCACGLEPSEVREYTGTTWKNDRF